MTMTDAMNDVNEYWDRRCSECKNKYSDSYKKCNENTYHCLLMENGN